MNYKIYFEDRFKQKRLVGNVEISENTSDIDFHKAVWPIMRDYITKLNPNYKIYYTRHFGNPNSENGLCYDVGSHSEFFYVYAESLAPESVVEETAEDNSVDKIFFTTYQAKDSLFSIIDNLYHQGCLFEEEEEGLSKNLSILGDFLFATKQAFNYLDEYSAQGEEAKVLIAKINEIMTKEFKDE